MVTNSQALEARIFKLPGVSFIQLPIDSEKPVEIPPDRSKDEIMVRGIDSNRTLVQFIIRLDSDPLGIVRIVSATVLGKQVEHVEQIYGKIHDDNELPVYSSMPGPDQYFGYLTVYHPNNTEFQAAHALLSLENL